MKGDHKGKGGGEMQVVMGSGEGVHCLATFLQQFNVVTVVVVEKEKRSYVQGLGKHTVNMFVY